MGRVGLQIAEASTVFVGILAARHQVRDQRLLCAVTMHLPRVLPNLPAAAAVQLLEVLPELNWRSTAVLDMLEPLLLEKGVSCGAQDLQSSCCSGGFRKSWFMPRRNMSHSRGGELLQFCRLVNSLYGSESQ